MQFTSPSSECDGNLLPAKAQNRRLRQATRAPGNTQEIPDCANLVMGTYASTYASESIRTRLRLHQRALLQFSADFTPYCPLPPFHSLLVTVVLVQVLIKLWLTISLYLSPSIPALPCESRVARSQNGYTAKQRYASIPYRFSLRRSKLSYPQSLVLI